MRRIGVVVALWVGMASAVAAQDLEYTSVTQISVSPSLGPMSTMLGGARNMSSHVFVKGSRLRIDFGTSSSILDAERRQVTMLDHTHHKYATSPLRETVDTRSDSLADAAGAVLSVQPTREVKRVNGVPARCTNIIVRVPARNARAPKAADLIVINELWTSDANGIGRAYERVKDIADQMSAGGAIMFGMLMQNPRAGAAMQKATKAAAQVHGMPVRAIVAYGNIAAGSKFVPGMRIDTMMAIVTNLGGVRTASLAKSLFEVPAGYTR